MLSYKQPPLKERILRSTSQHSPSSTVLHARPREYKKWDSDQLTQAYDAVSRGGYSIRRAAEEYQVPRSTLHDRLSGKVPFGARSGPPRYLTDQEETELSDFLCNCAMVGYARTRLQVFAVVQQALKGKGLEVRVTNGWWESFKRRHTKLKLRTAEPLAYARLVASSPAVLDHYYDLLESTLEENGLLDKPCQIFNVDESGMPLDPPSLKVVVPLGARHSQVVSTGDKSQVTVLACCSAAGYTMPPMAIFDRKTLKPEMTIGEVPGTMYGLSSSGWVDTELFELWFNHHFLAYAPPARPLLLLLDGHSSHYQPGIVKKAAEEQVIIFCLPPHTTHLTQPLDKGCFGPLKMFWREECQMYLASNPGKVVTRFQFCQLFSRAWYRGMSMTNAITGFRITGIFPFNRYALRPRKDHLQQPKQRSLAEQTGLKYIPLFTPARTRRQSRVATPSFSEPEVARFQVRFEEGYDLDDPRYTLWKKMYHPVTTSPEIASSRLPYPSPSPPPPSPGQLNLSECESPCSDANRSLTPEKEEVGVRVLTRPTVLSKFLSHPAPQLKQPAKNPKSSARVLTSAENIRILEDKQRKKREQEEMKERRKREREAKRLLKGQKCSTCVGRVY